jgi:uncharacterized repeat protein (TIGR03803 family)
MHNFDFTDGGDPSASLLQGTDGYLYGTTYSGGSTEEYFLGTAFKIAPNGSFVTLHSFCSVYVNSICEDGAAPSGSLLETVDGNVYGTTQGGGPSSAGIVFKLTPGGVLTTLYAFCTLPDCKDGRTPGYGLIQAKDGSFYGTTLAGGNGYGTVFKITPAGALTTLYSFCSRTDCPDGSDPEALVQAADGDFYGTTYGGGSQGAGTIFKMTAVGKLTTLYSFCFESNCADGASPSSTLVQSSDGDFYGTTSGGGLSDFCADNCGTIFRITPDGTLTTLYDFCAQTGCTDGETPNGALVLATDGNFYGTTEKGGDSGGGTVFKITPEGMRTTLYSFCPRLGCSDGDDPAAGLVQDTNGQFYGTASAGGPGVFCGSSGCGTVFALSAGLRPFVLTQPESAAVGKPVNVLGTNLTGATSVTFNGIAATFTVESGSLIRATVPTGATTGLVQVVTPGGTRSSNVPFRVVQ